MSLRGVSEPVGLLGLTIYTRPVLAGFGDDAALASITGRSCSYLLLRGTSLTSTPAVCASLPRAGKVGTASTSFLPGLRKVMAAMHRILPEPQARTICSRLTRCWAVSFSSRVSYSVRG